eukprot:UN1687
MTPFPLSLVRVPGRTQIASFLYREVGSRLSPRAGLASRYGSPRPRTRCLQQDEHAGPAPTLGTRQWPRGKWAPPRRSRPLPIVVTCSAPLLGI